MNRTGNRRSAYWRGGTVWLVAWAVMFLLDGHVDLGNLALILVLASALAALWLPAALSIGACAIGAMAFNYSFVPPRGTFSVDLQQDALLLVTMLAVSALVSLLVDRQRRLADNEREQRLRADQLRGLGEALRDTDDPRAGSELLESALQRFARGGVVLMLLDESPSDTQSATDVPLMGSASPDERVALWLCMRQSPVTGAPGRHEAGAWYLPVRGRSGNFGAALLRLPTPPNDAPDLREHVQALCDQMGLALERAAAVRSAAVAREAERANALRTTLLASISHDLRTPLAIIMGAGSSLLEQEGRLAPDQRRRLAASIVDEATQLARITENTLQLARLGSAGLGLHRDWESVEELVGTAVRRVRQRNASHDLTTQVENDLPLLRCDALLLVQVLDNLIDNAFKYGGAGAVEIVAEQRGGEVVIAVLDRGPGVPVEWRDRIFDTFQRVPPQAGVDTPARRGAGVGLAMCRAVARAHGGDVLWRARDGGGSRFELVLPIESAPGGPPELATAQP